jgi:phosphate:Na+ symporter
VVLLPVFLWGIGWAQKHAGLDGGAMSLAAFHTVFIGVGVAIFLPFVDRFARLIERALPDREPALTRHLDKTVLQAPAVALEATRRALRETAAETFHALQATLGGSAAGGDAREIQLRHALDRLQEFFPQIPPVAEDEPLSQLRIAQMHAMDHLTRLQTRLTPPASVRRVLADPRLQAAVTLTRAILEQGEAGLRGNAPDDWLTRVQQQASELEELRRKERPLILQQTAGGASAPAQALDVLDTMRWLDRVGYHTWRICNYLGREDKPETAVTNANPEE